MDSLCTAKKYKYSKGLTLLEILITLVVLSLGLLGVAALQGQSITANYNSYLYSQASSLGYEMAERIRINSSAITSYHTGGLTSSVLGADCEGASCTATQFATYDMDKWLKRVSELPEGVGSITGVAGSPASATIIIRWRGFGNGNCNAQGSSSADVYTCFRLNLDIYQ